MSFEEDTLIMFGHFESNGFELFSEVKAANSTRVLTTINVLGNMQCPIVRIVTRDFTTFWHFHVQRPGSKSLWICLHIVNLFGFSSMEENHAKGKADSRPRGSGRVGEIIVNSFSHAVTTNV